MQQLLGEDAYSGDQDDVPVDERRLPDTPVATVVRAFFLQLPVPRGEAVRAYEFAREAYRQRIKESE